MLANSLEAFLKTTFEDHIFKCCATNPKFAFAKGDFIEKQKCATCTLSQVAMQYLKEHTEEWHHALLDKCKDKLVLYQGLWTMWLINSKQSIIFLIT